MTNTIRYTVKDKQIFREKTLEMLREGIGQNEISRKLGVSSQYISRLKKTLVKEGFITQKEIDEKKAVTLEKIREEKKKTSKKKSKEEQNQETENRRNMVLQRYKEGKTRTAIMRELGIPRTTICRDEKKLIEAGLLFQEEIVKQQDLEEIERAKRNDTIRRLLDEGTMTIAEIAREVNVSDTIVYHVAANRLEKVRQNNIKNSQLKKEKKRVFLYNPEALNHLQSIERDVYNELRKGYPYLYIENKLGITHEKCMAIVEVLSVTGAFSRNDIKKARDALRARDKIEIIALLKQGYTQSSIINLKRYLNSATCSRIVTELKKEGKITEEEIESAQVESNKRYENIVLSGMQQGLTVKEIIDSDEDGYLTESIVRRTKRKLIEKGFISEKKFNNRNRKRQQKFLDASKKELDDEYIKLFKKGLTFEEIAKLRHISFKTVKEKWYKIKKKYRISKEKLAEWREKRRTKFEEGKEALDKYIDDGKGIKIVQKYFEICIEEKSFGRSFSEDEVEKFGRVLLMDESFLNLNNLKFVIFLYIEQLPQQKTQAYLSKLLSYYSYTRYDKAITKFSNEFYEATKRTKQLSTDVDIQEL